MSAKDLKAHPFIGQVIIEKGFKSEQAAINWMEKMSGVGEKIADNVESHLWENVGMKR